MIKGIEGKQADQIPVFTAFGLLCLLLKAVIFILLCLAALLYPAEKLQYLIIGIQVSWQVIQTLFSIMEGGGKLGKTGIQLFGILHFGDNQNNTF